MLINNEHIDEQSLPQNLENFTFLREKALQYIRQTTSDSWTDHNIHDPGITIMEAICYALSDVGFRMNFPVKDLFTDEENRLNKNTFYKPQDILPSHAVTINDFRKLLIDLDLVKNAWISPLFDKNNLIKTDYEKMYIYKKEAKLLTLKDVNKLSIPDAEKQTIINNNEVFISGLYAVSVEFEPQQMIGSIDSGEIFEPIYDKDFFGNIYYEISNWNELINSKEILQTIAKAYNAKNPKISLVFNESSKNKYNNNDGKLFDRTLNDWYFDIHVSCNSNWVFTLKDVHFIPYLEGKKGIIGNDLLTILNRDNFKFFSTCFQKIAALSKAYSDVQNVLHQNRNLCEDFLPQIAAIPTVDFRICADIDVAANADIEQVQTEIFYKVEQYISPNIKFYTYKEMQEKGKAIEEILEGPKLQHGFIDEEAMGENSFQNYTIYLSDVINTIYETEGLINCRNLQFFLMGENGNNIPQPNSWEINVPSGYKPVLNKRKTKFIFYKNELPLSPNFSESILKYNFINISNVKNVNSNIAEPVLNNTYRDLAIHYALADEFPATYKIGRNLPNDYLNDINNYRSKQLEGYLLMFEQIIANFLNDLDQLKNTLSWNDIEHVQYTSSNNSWRRNYLIKNENIDAIWQDVVESKQQFVKKRNQSLDYLLACFAEDLTGLDNYFYLSTDNLEINAEEYYQYLIQLKQRFLSNYIIISANRGAAVNIYEDFSYKKTKLSGYENRLSNLLGCELLKNNLRKTTSNITENKEERGYFHVLEHILLRVPVLNNDIIQTLESQNIEIEILSICADEDCTACSGEDPYSFTASIILPSWIKVYSDVHYRDYIEKIIRKETATTVLLRICWIDKISMEEYENKIEAWWKAKYDLFHCDSTTYNQKAVEYIKAQNDFIKVIKKQRSDYFEATLHDCKDENEENNTRIFLDKTKLGNS